MRKAVITAVCMFLLAGCSDDGRDVFTAAEDFKDKVKEAAGEVVDHTVSAETEPESEPEPVPESEPEYAVGETWTVDGEWSLTVLSAEETDKRNPYAGGRMAYSYPGEITYYADMAPAGTYCVAEACIGVDNPGDFRIYLDEYDADMNRQEAILHIEPGKTAEKSAVQVHGIDTEGAYRLGDTWKVDDLFSLTIHDISESSYRNAYTHLQPETVYLINYSYENLGYESSYMNGLYIDLEIDTVIDADGQLASSYPGGTGIYPQVVPIGAACDAEAWIAVDHPGDLTLIVTVTDDDYNRYEAVFVLSPEME
ncbi:MAG: hypothetical protein IJJ29_00585 [Solobacterium sp.]|nr:hypothetical protein [Solobacterium sp.]